MKHFEIREDFFENFPCIKCLYLLNVFILSLSKKYEMSIHHKYRFPCKESQFNNFFGS